MIPSAGTSHLSDDQLVLFLDGGADAELRAHAADHLRTCGECAHRAEWLRERAEALDARLAELDWTPPEALLPRSFHEVRRRRARRRFGTPIRWAAGIAVVLLAGAVAASPLRARVVDWAVERWSQAVAVLAGTPAPEPAAGAPEGEPAHTEYRFVPEGGELRLELASTQQEGTVVVRTTAEPAAVLVVLDSGPEREPVWVLPGRVEIRNSPGSTASYRITLPGTVRVLRVRVGGRSWSTLRTGEFRPGEEHVLPLRDR